MPASGADSPVSTKASGYGVMHPDLAPTRATVHTATVHTAGGIAGWQVALIVVCAAAIAAGVSLLVARIRGSRPASTPPAA